MAKEQKTTAVQEPPVVQPVAAPPEPERKVEPLSPTRFATGEFKRVHYVATAHEHTRPDDLLKPDYWAHVAQQLRPWDKIEVRANDGIWYAEFLVLEAGRNWARVFPLCQHHLTTADVAQSQAESLSPYSVEYRGPHCKWSVIRKSDRQVVHEMEDTRDGAAGWLRERLKAE